MISDEELVNIFLIHPTLSTGQLSQMLGLPERSLQYRLTRPGFAVKLAVKRKSSISDAAELGASGLSECLEVLQKEMRSDTNYSGERVNAAKVFAQIAFKANEEAITRVELLRLRAFIEQKEAERTGISFSIDSELDEDSTGRCTNVKHNDHPADSTSRMPVEGSATVAENTHRMPQDQRSEVPQGDSTGQADRPADAILDKNLVIADNVQNKLMMIINKHIGRE